MRCRVCGGPLESEVSDLPFKLGAHSILIVRSMPVLQCTQCGETELENEAMARVDRLLAQADSTAELEVVRYAA